MLYSTWSNKNLVEAQGPCDESLGLLSNYSAYFFREYTECSSRDKNHQKNSWQLITLYLNSAQDVFEHKNKQDLSESKLFGELSGSLF